MKNGSGFVLYYLSQYLLEIADGTEWAGRISGLRVFSYITFRSAGAAITALLLSWWWGPIIINWLKSIKSAQLYKDEASKTGDLKMRILDKSGTPTMGGLIIVLVLDLSALLWAQWNALVLLTMLSVIILCALGFYDDYKKITKQNSAGITSNLKLVVQIALALFISIYLWQLPMLSLMRSESYNLVGDIMVPFFKHPVLTGVGGIGVGITVLAIVGSSNAVNLTDGLDGLAIGCTSIVAFVFLVFTYVAGHSIFANYLQIPYVPGAGELTVFCSALLGAGMGFLWFNCHPASVFMGDTGSLALGGALGIVAVLIHQPFILVIAGGVFVAEAASTIIQRGWFKFTKWKYGTGRRVFLRAPLHHHFEKLDWYESKVVTRFYIAGILCAMIALATLKIR